MRLSILWESYSCKDQLVDDVEGAELISYGRCVFEDESCGRMNERDQV